MLHSVSTEQEEKCEASCRQKNFLKIICLRKSLLARSIFYCNFTFLHSYFRYISSKSVSSSATSKATTNPIYESEENAGYDHDLESAIEMHTTTDNVLYERSNELFEENPLYQATEYGDDSTYAKPNE